MKRPWEWFRQLFGDEEAPRTEIEGMPFRAVAEGPPMPVIETEDVTLDPLPDGGKPLEGL